MLDYILAIYLNGAPQYIGTFTSCDDAEAYVRTYYPEHDSLCQHRDYIYLPLDLQEKFFVPYPNGTWESVTH